MILVFGGDGQLGRELARAAGRHAIPLAAIGRTRADIADRASVEQALNEIAPSLVVNAAAYTKVDLAEREIAAAERDNAAGPGILAAACAAADIPIIHLSTDYVFDGTKPGPYLETDTINPLGVYGRTKAAGEEAVRGTFANHLILRTAWVYGEFGSNFLKTIVRLARERDELRVVADQRGSPTSTRDLATAILHIASRLTAREPAWGTYHFTGTGITTWHDFAKRIVAAQALLTGHNPKVTAIATTDFPTAARRPANSALDSSRFEQMFGVRARPWDEEVDEITVAVVNAQSRSEVGAGLLHGRP
jgi:dTDP-4-dehydrorhamnose reductase